MADSAMTFDIEPCHSFLMAAKYDFVSHNIKTGSLVYLNDSSEKYDLWSMKIRISINDKECESRVCKTGSIHNTGEDTDGKAIEPCRCDLCHLPQHKLSHAANTPCRYDLCHLPQHYLSHSDVKLYQCRTCNKRFTESGYLKIHQRIHSGVKPYTCGACNKQFRWRESLKAHK